jgi:hypothetical protein
MEREPSALRANDPEKRKMRSNTALIKATTIGTSTRVQTAGTDPARAIQLAWSVYRLPELHELMLLAIAELRAVVPGELLGRELSDLDLSECSPVAEALEACCAELREESGMPLAETDRQGHCERVRSYIEQQPPAWVATFNEALAKYRSAAAVTLQALLRDRGVA